MKLIYVMATLAALGPATVAHSQEPSTAQVLAAHLKAFGSGNVEAVLANYSHDAFIVLPNGVLKGKEQIRGLFSALLSEFGKPEAKFELISQTTEGPIAYIVWKAETSGQIYRIGSDTFVVRGGKIVQQTNIYDAAKK
jgi:ketosteroid isomerase-like protein